MKAIAYINTDGEFKGTERIQMKYVSKIAEKHNADIVDSCSVSAPAETLLSAIKDDVKVSFDAILVQDKACISESFSEVFAFYKACKQEGILLYTLTDGSFSDMLQTVIRSGKKAENEMISKETRKRMTRLASEGKYLGGRLKMDPAVKTQFFRF